jgi:hypothetical protein
VMTSWSAGSTGVGFFLSLGVDAKDRRADFGLLRNG